MPGDVIDVALQKIPESGSATGKKPLDAPSQEGSNN
jgi:hypothetical protein